MKKYLYTLLILVFCFFASSFSLIVVYPFNAEPSIDSNISESTQKLYAIMDAVKHYYPIYEDNTNPVVNRLACELAANMIIDYDKVTADLELNPDSVTITAGFIDPNKIKLHNNIEYDFAEYAWYIKDLSDDAMIQIYELIKDISLYTREYSIKINFGKTDDYLIQTAIFNSKDIDTLEKICYEDAQNIYSEYLSKSEISNAFFCKAIKELPLDNITDIYNVNNPENSIIEDWQIQLYKYFAQYYLDRMVIENIIKTNVNAPVSSGTINYKIEPGNETFANICENMLDIYYTNKQAPIDKNLVIEDFAKYLNVYYYSDSSQLNTKTFNFTYSQNLNEFNINDDFYVEIVNDIYEEFIKFEEVFNPFYSKLQEEYFFIERPYLETTVIIDNTGGSRFRQVKINVQCLTDCYIKIFSYDYTSDILDDIIYSAYIKSGETMQLFLPEGDYIVKYATGEKWYGNIHKFSDTGHYIAFSNVLSVHEDMMTTIIELGSSTVDSSQTYSQTPDLF